MSDSGTRGTEIDRLALALSQAKRPRCEHGHDGISLNVQEERPDCPVPEHTPTQIIDLADASVVWEANRRSEVSA